MNKYLKVDIKYILEGAEKTKIEVCGIARGIETEREDKIMAMLQNGEDVVRLRCRIKKEKKSEILNLLKTSSESNLEIKVRGVCTNADFAAIGDKTVYVSEIILGDYKLECIPLKRLNDK